MREFAKLLIVVGLLTGGWQAGAAGLPDWAKLSLRLSGENWEVRKNVVGELRARPKLTAELESALENPDLRPLAIDVLVALKSNALNEKLFSLVARDPDGLFVLALNTLAKPAERKKVENLYLELLKKQQLALPTQIAVFDSLGRMKSEVDLEILEIYLASEDADVKRAALNYVREFWNFHPPRKAALASWVKLLSPELSEGPYQTRLQTYYLIFENRKFFGEQMTQFTEQCKADKNMEVRRYCAAQGKKVG